MDFLTPLGHSTLAVFESGLSNSGAKAILMYHSQFCTNQGDNTARRSEALCVRHPPTLRGEVIMVALHSSEGYTFGIETMSKDASRNIYLYPNPSHW